MSNNSKDKQHSKPSLARRLWNKAYEGIADACYIWWLELKNTIKDEGVLIFFLLVPIAYPLAYSWIYNNEVVENVPVAVVDMSHSHSSREFTKRLDASPHTKVAYHCTSLAEAQSLVGHQVVHGVIYFPSDFEHKIYRVEQGHVSVYCDMSLMLNYKAIYQTALAVSLDMGHELQLPHLHSFTKQDEELNSKPLKVEEISIFNSTGGYGNAILPAVLLLIIQQTLLLGIGLSAGTARENNRFQDLVPLSRHYNGVFRIVIGKAMAYLMIYSVMGAYITLCIPRFFSFTSMLHYSDLIGLMLPFLLACIFFGMMLSCIVRYRENIMLLVVFTSIPMLFLTGISWPQSNIPAFWQGISWLIPSTFGVRGFIHMSSMGGTLHDIRQEYLALWIQAVVYFFAACMVYNYQLARTHRHAQQHIESMKSKIHNVLQRRKTAQAATETVQ